MNLFEIYNKLKLINLIFLINFIINYKPILYYFKDIQLALLFLPDY